MGHAGLDALFEQARQRNVAQLHVSMGIVLQLQSRDADEFIRIEALDNALSDQGNAIAMTHQPPLPDRTFDHITDMVEGDRVLSELLRNHRQRRTRGLANAECQVAGFASHRLDDVPATGCAGVLHQIVHQSDTDVAGGLISKGGHVVR